MTDIGERAWELHRQRLTWEQIAQRIHVWDGFNLHTGTYKPDAGRAAGLALAYGLRTGQLTPPDLDSIDPDDRAAILAMMKPPAA